MVPNAAYDCSVNYRSDHDKLVSDHTEITRRINKGKLIEVLSHMHAIIRINKGGG
jgi:hypothetical protein